VQYETEQIKAFLARGHPRLAFAIACLRFLRGPMLAVSILAMLVAYPAMPAEAIRAVAAAIR
jgi:hypothetical protein